MFEIRCVRTNEVWSVKTCVGLAMDTADAMKIVHTKEDFCVVELRAVYHTGDSTYSLRSVGQVLSRANSTLLAGWERFRSLRNKLRTQRG